MAQWKGLRVEVPGSIFYEPNKTWLGTVTGIVPGNRASKKKSVYVEFDDEEEKYWFKMTDVVEWLVDKEKAELLRSSIYSTPKRRTRTKSPSMEPSVSAKSDVDEPAPARAPSRSPAGEGAEAPEKSIAASENMLPLPPPLPPIDEVLRSQLDSPSGSIAGKLHSWVSKKLRPHVEEVEKDKSTMGKGGEMEAMEFPDKGFETEEEVLDDCDLDRISGGTGTPIQARVSEKGSWLGRMKEVFYTPLPFTPISFRRQRLGLYEDSSLREREEQDTVASRLRDGSMERSVLYPVHGFRMINNPPSDEGIEAPEQENPAAPSSGYGTRMYGSFKSIFYRQRMDDVLPVPSRSAPKCWTWWPRMDIAQSSSDSELCDDDIVSNEETDVQVRELQRQRPTIRWHIPHIVCALVIVAVWGSFFLYWDQGTQAEEGKLERPGDAL